ncbi:MAG: hypothetical protein ACOCYE_03790 [Pseudomonadota bacterium]
MTTQRPASLLWLVAGFGLWGTALVTLYAAHAVGCAFAWPAPGIRLALAAILAGHLAALLALIGYQRRRTGTDPRLQVAFWMLVLGLVATAFTFGPPLLLTPCV